MGIGSGLALITYREDMSSIIYIIEDTAVVWLPR